MTDTKASSRPQAPDVGGETLLVVIPAYNEEERIGEVISGVRRVLPQAHILVIDDDSKDDTARVARAGGAAVLSLPFNLGYGVALQTGYKYALDRDYRYLIQIDGDGQHDPEYCVKLLDEVASGRADVCLGSRFGHREGYRVPLLRRAGIRCFRKAVQWLTGLPVQDPTSGFQALNRDTLEFFCSEIYPSDYPDADVLIMLHYAGFTVREVPVRMFSAPGKSTSMHQGLKPIYYMFKLSLSILVTIMRKSSLAEHRKRKRSAASGAAPERSR